MMNKGILYKIFIIPLLLIPLVCPFHIFAGTVSGDAPIIGVNVYVIDYEYGRIPVQGTVTLETDMTRWQCVSGSSSRCAVWQSQDTSDNVQNDITGTITYTNGSYSGYLYEFDFVFDDEYVGYVRFNSQITAGSGNIYYVNGSHLTITSTTLINSFTITEYQLTKKSGSSMWLYPFESFNFIYYFTNNGFEQVGLQNLGDYQFPIFDVKQNTQIFRTRIAAGGTHRIIFFIDKYIASSTFFTYFSVSDSNLVKQNDKIIRRLMPNPSGTTTYVVYSVELYNPTSSAINYNLSYIGADCNFMPIYYDYPTNDYISTDFALLFGLSNDLLDNVQVIANGTSNSNADASNLETVSDNISSSSDDLIQSENSFNNSMNSNLQQIDTNINIGNLGNKFLSSADWVRVQFNTLTNGTPFGSVLSFSLLLGLALVLVGRIRK